MPHKYTYDSKFKRDERKRQFVQVNRSIKTNRGCLICGYSKCDDALCWHHIKGTKRFEINNKRSISISNYFSEIEKCICVCANCHSEIHAGLHPQYSVQNGEADVQDNNQLGLFKQAAGL